jgi:hypothetical protein
MAGRIALPTGVSDLCSRSQGREPRSAVRPEMTAAHEGEVVCRNPLAHTITLKPAAHWADMRVNDP